MSKQPRLIDADKLLGDMKQHLKKLEGQLPIDDEIRFQRNDAQLDILELYIQKFEKGEFDLTTEPRPNYKVTYNRCRNHIVPIYVEEYIVRPSENEMEHTKQLLMAEEYVLEMYLRR
ncbi:MULTISPECIES: hypothetical protein [Paenibacillus]|uniref:hypothetical protein n=1 Tax=Paenibacillus TaxID=44249 RepID=UPI00096F7279|nr:hypothetical protein [Paenibacillus odorifer]OMD87806.1 hypothetical protein BSK53_02115 [Paenibacillus odorifer]